MEQWITIALLAGIWVTLLLRKPVAPTVISQASPSVDEPEWVKALNVSVAAVAEGVAKPAPQPTPVAAQTATPSPAPRPAPSRQLQIVKLDGGRTVRVGERPLGHPDLREAWNTPGLAIRRPDGRVFEGVQDV